MFNTTLFKPVNMLIIGVIAAVFVLTLGKFFSSHINNGGSNGG